MSRFPTRTLVLMVLSLLAFVWFWLQMHRNHASVPVEVVTIDAGAP